MADNFKPCSVDGCKNNAHWRASGKRGWCAMHHKRWRKHGDPLKGARADAMQFFRDVVLTYTGDECLIWPFSRTDHGYAQLRYNGRARRVHRIVCEYVNGKPPSPEKRNAAHSCGNGHLGCVTPKHLRWATHIENMEDRHKHGTNLRGERQNGARLTSDDVRRIRSLFKEKSKHEIAVMFGVSDAAIYDIYRRRNWGWLDN